MLWWLHSPFKTPAVAPHCLLNTAQSYNLAMSLLAPWPIPAFPLQIVFPSLISFVNWLLAGFGQCTDDRPEVKWAGYLLRPSQTVSLWLWSGSHQTNTLSLHPILTGRPLLGIKHPWGQPRFSGSCPVGGSSFLVWIPRGRHHPLVTFIPVTNPNTFVTNSYYYILSVGTSIVL